ncbi:uncharacterized protein PITG_14846 [Phytophthora infestans T30-4]|uniref:Inhibitor of growth protein n=1 Tax=Phytophthora infestans (strain T30-4) TaxID=403677 RepID=D0NP64_PHYIT|nr:uncharacterized protein PITG_14846 [Phytophthora infestans T30-4]EEY62406.1 conserved hypothetical protein [Phytophthora infestans T30-4]|eukprot:XP_002899042.1 conserved hypothetical protein [Phytophthora infestans T30-4]
MNKKLDEKIAIAAQSYDIVDHHIRRLDRDLESYSALVTANGEYQEDSIPQRKKQKVAAATSVHQVSHTVPNVNVRIKEQHKCRHCRRVSVGQMVGCDNDDCKYEWFHFGCVGLADQPAGKWYCQDCKVQLIK